MARVRFLSAVAVLGSLAVPFAATAQPPTESLPKILRPTAPPSPTPGSPGVVLPGTRADVFSTIQGNALTSTNARLTDATVRLRNARTGAVVDVTTTDKTGMFTFKHVSPGSYVAEIVGPDQKTLAASQILYVNAGEAVSALVKLPFRLPPFAGVLGNTAPAAAIITTTAAASGVLATAVTATDVSPRR